MAERLRGRGLLAAPDERVRVIPGEAQRPYVRAPIAHEDRRAPRERPGAGERPLRPTPVAPIAKRVKIPRS